MDKLISKFIWVACTVICFCFSCDNEVESLIPATDISDVIVGEWVYDNPEDGAWQSMKFIGEGGFFCYSDNKEKWSIALKNIEAGNYGVKGNEVSAVNGSTRLAMKVTDINGYGFTAIYNETTVEFKFQKVVMRTHLHFGESVIPPYADLVDAEVIGYKSHDEDIAFVDTNTGEITAMANNGRTYVDIVTTNGTAVVKVMVGKVDDGDEAEISPIVEKPVILPKPELDLEKAIVGRWIWDKNYWEVINFYEDGKVSYSNMDPSRGIYNENADGSYSIDKDNNILTLRVRPNGAIPMTVLMEVKSINKYSFTAKSFIVDGESTGTYTYSKQIGYLEIKKGEVMLSHFEEFVEKGTAIIGIKSHNPDIAEIDSETGELIGKRGGRTYVDVITDEGTAVVEVNVKSFMNYDYEDFIGASKKTITDTFGTVYSLSENGIIYNYRHGSSAELKGLIKDVNWDQIYFKIDFLVDRVKAISMKAKKDSWFTSEEMNLFLLQRFFVSPASTAEKKYYVNAEKSEEATIEITWDMTSKVLDFSEIIR